MRKIYILTFLLANFLTYGQLSENFDADATLPAGWAVFRGANDSGIFIFARLCIDAFGCLLFIESQSDFLRIDDGFAGFRILPQTRFVQGE